MAHTPKVTGAAIGRILQAHPLNLVKSAKYGKSSYSEGYLVETWPDWPGRAAVTYMVPHVTNGTHNQVSRNVLNQAAQVLTAAGYQVDINPAPQAPQLTVSLPAAPAPAPAPLRSSVPDDRLCVNCASPHVDWADGRCRACGWMQFAPAVKVDPAPDAAPAHAPAPWALPDAPALPVGRMAAINTGILNLNLLTAADYQHALTVLSAMAARAAANRAPAPATPDAHHYACAIVRQRIGQMIGGQIPNTVSVTDAIYPDAPAVYLMPAAGCAFSAYDNLVNTIGQAHDLDVTPGYYSARVTLVK